jgi:hypothetical protein
MLSLLWGFQQGPTNRRFEKIQQPCLNSWPLYLGHHETGTKSDHSIFDNQTWGY